MDAQDERLYLLHLLQEHLHTLARNRPADGAACEIWKMAMSDVGTTVARLRRLVECEQQAKAS